MRCAAGQQRQLGRGAAQFEAKAEALGLQGCGKRGLKCSSVQLDDPEGWKARSRMAQNQTIEDDGKTADI